ncbi:amidohydrolase family protein [Methanolobus profundi]|uniref:Cytosine/adenosine deaminase n=1 Tax=Methanolobus profundi TaxID=487685 RepID=A0A1I4QY43_9EURY|nr:amidohydrolase family protein [Methanolobus profundi]SFM44931.1 Cytosine/adenosine deaminase [Methanolobus profundi]
MPCEQTISGKIIYGPEAEVIEGYIVVEDGIIKEVHEKRTDSNNIIAPCFVNAHTHIGDSVLKDPVLGELSGHYVKRDLSQLVQPPHGLKHRILNRTSHKDMVKAMQGSLQDMHDTGTCAFADFREGGMKGVLALKEALEGSEIEGRIFGRPVSSETKDLSKELTELLDYADGLGMSGANDIDMEFIEKARKCSQDKYRTFAIHSGENNRSDIEKALSLDPDILIHMTQANPSDLREVADRDIPIVVCPRSNFITGVGMAPVIEMLDQGIKVAVGTDNVMLNSGNMFAEMEFLSKIFGIEDRQVFMMCTLMGATILELDTTGSILEGNLAKLMIINGNSNNLTGIRDPISGIVRRGRPDDILSVMI